MNVTHLPTTIVGHEAESSFGDVPSDAELVERYRAGDQEAAATLFRRHHAALRAFAASLAGPSQADDLAAEAFARVLSALQRGLACDAPIRPYLLTTVRNLFTSGVRRDSRHVWVDDHERLGSLEPASDGTGLRLESSVLAAAFRSLPERWQTALWLVDVERVGQQEAGRRMGLTTGAANALAVRAREGLRLAYLAQHLSAASDPECRLVREQLPARQRGRLRPRAARMVEEHLDGCVACVAVAEDLRGVSAVSAVALGPAVLVGAGGAIGWADGWSGSGIALTTAQGAGVGTGVVAAAGGFTAVVGSVVTAAAVAAAVLIAPLVGDAHGAPTTTTASPAAAEVLAPTGQVVDGPTVTAASGTAASATSSSCLAAASSGDVSSAPGSPSGGLMRTLSGIVAPTVGVLAPQQSVATQAAAPDTCTTPRASGPGEPRTDMATPVAGGPQAAVSPAPLTDVVTDVVAGVGAVVAGVGSTVEGVGSLPAAVEQLKPAADAIGEVVTDLVGSVGMSGLVVP